MPGEGLYLSVPMGGSPTVGAHGPGRICVPVTLRLVYVRGERYLYMCVDMSCVPALTSLLFSEASKGRSFYGEGIPSRPLKCQLSRLQAPELAASTPLPAGEEEQQSLSINTDLCAEHSNSASQVESLGSHLLISHPGEKIACVGVDNVFACFRGILDHLNAPHLPSTLSRGSVSLHSRLREMVQHFALTHRLFQTGQLLSKCHLG